MNIIRRKQIEAIFNDFHAIRRAYSDGSRFSSRRFGMTFMQASVLMMLMHEHDQTIGQLALTLGVSKSAMSQLIDGLMERGFIERNVSADDRRVAYVTLTKRGIMHLGRMRREGAKGMMEMFDRLDDIEIEQIRQITEKLAKGSIRSDHA
jgi:DNA-binding MarR family transcriptional regulator